MSSKPQPKPRAAPTPNIRKASAPQLAAIASECLGMASRAASRATARVFSLRLAPLNLEATQFPILLELRLGGETTIAALAQTLDLDPSTVTRSVQPLERRGLIAAQGGRGRSGKRLTLSKSGETALEKAVAEWRAAQAAIVAEMETDDVAALRATLPRLKAAADRAQRKLEAR